MTLTLVVKKALHGTHTAGNAARGADLKASRKQ